MSLNSIIFTIVACIAVVVMVLAVIVFGRNKSGSQKIANLQEYINDQIYVGNLPYHVGENELQDHFSKYGNVQGIRIVRNFRTGRSKGYAFVTYGDSKQASVALAAHGEDLFGRSMVVRIAKPRQQQAF